MSSNMSLLFDFVFLYPLFMSAVWMCGALYYFFHWEDGGKRTVEEPPELEEHPLVTFIIPCHNESDSIGDTMRSLLSQKYPNFEIIAVNDNSTDNTGELLDRFGKRDARIRALHFTRNQGKAVGLRTAALVAKGEYLVCIDGDAMLDPYATNWLMWHFLNSENVGAITGNPRIRNRSSLLGKIQVGEFSSIIGMIKRSQRIYGRVFSISGVIAAFRKSALHDVGYWDTDMITEDISVSWKLQLRGWEVRFEPNALCWILMPETWGGIWKQRLRWAQGGVEVGIRYVGQIFKWKHRSMWPLYAELITSIFWAFAITAICGLWLVGKFIALPPDIHVASLVPAWHGLMLGMTCLIQFAVSLKIDGQYEKGNMTKYYYWVIWYPLFFWMLQVATVLVATPKALFKQRGKRAIWESPDRGIVQPAGEGAK